ncbi:hypothetical protein D3877_24400 [Azospirillum cavernae]|uniref:Uncharacterized protein n=1 Tax=Azospirillum cavernae TaxID=2320860 RepID=A0A418VPQ9_9PROT|nr:hypothetical protein D3877_24400 [Azospirillum cavernae]
MGVYPLAEQLDIAVNDLVGHLGRGADVNAVFFQAGDQIRTDGGMGAGHAVTGGQSLHKAIGRGPPIQIDFHAHAACVRSMLLVIQAIL